MRILGAVLAGGRSRRFGSDKAVALLDGETLIERVISALSGQVDAVVVCGRVMTIAGAGLTCVADRPAADLGPLGGLNAALFHAAQSGFDRVLSVPCDAPFLPGDLAARLGEPSSYASALPVIGLWPASLSAVLDRHLAVSEDRSMRGWAALVGARGVAIGGLDNVNTQADLAQLASERQSASST